MGVFLKSLRENGTSQGSSEAEAQEVKKRALGAAEAESMRAMDVDFDSDCCPNARSSQPRRAHRCTQPPLKRIREHSIIFSLLLPVKEKSDCESDSDSNYYASDNDSDDSDCASASDGASKESHSKDSCQEGVRLQRRRSPERPPRPRLFPRRLPGFVLGQSLSRHSQEFSFLHLQVSPLGVPEVNDSVPSRQPRRPRRRRSRTPLMTP